MNSCIRNQLYTINWHLKAPRRAAFPSPPYPPIISAAPFLQCRACCHTGLGSASKAAQTAVHAWVCGFVFIEATFHHDLCCFRRNHLSTLHIEQAAPLGFASPPYRSRSRTGNRERKGPLKTSFDLCFLGKCRGSPYLKRLHSSDCESYPLAAWRCDFMCFD